MDTWVHQQLRATYRRRVIAWCFVLACAVLFAVAQSRYITNFVSGPFDVGQPELDAIGDVSTEPRYFVRVTGSKAIETGIQQITTRKHAGVETSRSVSAAYYVLVIGDRLLVVKRAEGTPTTVQGALAAMPAELDRHLFNTPQMQAIRGRFYPYYLDDSRFRTPGYIGAVAALIFVILLVRYGYPAWRYARDVSSHPVVKRVALWGDPLSTAVEARREAATPRYKGGGWQVADKYLIRSAPFAFDLLRLSDLLWAYKRVTKHSVNFIPTGKTYSGVLVCYGGAAEVTGREKNVDALLTFAAERAPWAVFRYSDDFNKFFKQKSQEFCAAVEQRKRELAGQAPK